jgi:hypothetical protein
MACAVACATTTLGAQSARVTAVTSLQAVDLRPFVEDSVPIGSTSGDGPYRLLADGRLVRCVEGEAWCRFRRSGERTTAYPATQDLQVTAWGFGEGVSVHSHVRARAAIGDDLTWPRAGDHFDALAAWLEVDRQRFRARLGRQWAVSGLGVYNFDGAALLARRGTLSVEAFGGRSLVSGLNESHAGSALGGVNDLPPDESGYLMGARAAWRLAGGRAVSAVYQRNIRADRAGLYSERMSVDAVARVSGFSVDAGVAYDLLATEVNEARAGVSRELPANVSLTVDVRRYRPFFEAWTIWGAFSPVAYDEGRATVGWRAEDGVLRIDARGGWRRYGETDAGLESTPLRTSGWRAGVSAEWMRGRALLAHADYNIDVGFGASRSDAVAGVRWTPDERVTVGGTLSALQNIYEFRIGTGRIYGAGIEGSMRVSRDARLVVNAAFHAHRSSNGAPVTNWGQRRIATRLEWTLGGDPGAQAIRRARTSASGQ